MISSKQGVLITGGQFTQHYHAQTSVRNQVPIDVLMDAVAPSAFHDSGTSFDKPKCHPRTRVRILEDIMCWNIGEDEDARAWKQFMWLNGAAGCGKSAIAQSTIESCIGRGLLLASFFFNRSDPTRNHAGPLAATLAYQLYCAFPKTSVQTEILSAIQEDPMIFKKTLQRQFLALIIQPLKTHFSKDQSRHYRVPFLIVIDGLDECIDRTAQKAILTGLAESLRNSNLSIPIFIASRPEHDIKFSFASKFLKDVHTSLSLDIGNGYDGDYDIRLYLLDRFAEIKEDFDNRTTGRKLSQDWPGDKIIDTLVWKSSGQFVYAATIIRYVESTRHRPDRRLDVVLNLRPVNGNHPFAELDALYAMILKSALDIEKVLHVLSLHFMDVPPLCCSVIEKLLAYDEGEVETLFCDMSALVQISRDPSLHRHHDPENPPLYLRLLHASLGDYLLDPARSKQFHIDMDNEITKHVIHALQYFASCCSGFFNPKSNAAAPLYILRGSRHGYYFMGRRIGQIMMFSFELQNSVLSFPLKEFLEPHISTRAYPQLLKEFVTPFLELLNGIVRTNPTLSYIKDHHLGNLRSALMPQVQKYFSDDRLALVLVLFYHLASHRYVPILEKEYSYEWYSTPFYPIPGFNEEDALSLSYLWRGWSIPFCVGDNVYHRFVRQLLRDAGTTGEYALGATVHERAALACFKEFSTCTVPLLPSALGKNNIVAAVATTVAADNEEDHDDAYPKLTFNPANGGRWQLTFSGKWKVVDEELYFLLLGYLIFILPRCGRSDALIAACELEAQKMPYIDQQDVRFPVRRRLLHKEVNNYLARVSPTSCVGTKMRM